MTCKRVKLNSYEPLVRDKNMKFVTRSWYNKIFPFVKPFEFLKRNKNFQCQNIIGGKKDLWLVVLIMLSLRCQRTSITSLPLASSTNSRTNSLPELQAKTKYATTGHKRMHSKPRNLYKFIKVKQKVYSCGNKLTRCTD